MWTTPIIIDGKPIIDFSLGVHTPVALSEKDDIFYLEFKKIDLNERIWMELIHLPILKSILKKGFTPKIRRKYGYKKKIHYNGVPAEFIFDISKIKTAVIVGELPNYNDLPKKIRKIWGER